MKFIVLVAVALLAGCEKPLPVNPINTVQVSARYVAFEVPEYGLICVAGGSGQLSCVKEQSK